MKPFDLKAALAGAKVVTVSGEPVTGLHLGHGPGGRQCLIGVLTGELENWTYDGGYHFEWVSQSPLDLRMAEDDQS